jgi:hypothetical protein
MERGGPGTRGGCRIEVSSADAIIVVIVLFSASCSFSAFTGSLAEISEPVGYFANIPRRDKIVSVFGRFLRVRSGNDPHADFERKS